MFCSKCRKHTDKGKYCTFCGSVLHEKDLGFENTQTLMRFNIKPGKESPSNESGSVQNNNSKSVQDSEYGMEFINNTLTDFQNENDNILTSENTEMEFLDEIENQQPVFCQTEEYTENLNDEFYTDTIQNAEEDITSVPEFSAEENILSDDYKSDEPMKETELADSPSLKEPWNEPKSVVKKEELSADHLKDIASEKQTSPNITYGDIDPMFGPPPKMNYTTAAPPKKEETTGLFKKIFKKNK